jgi:hypothetical protein
MTRLNIDHHPVLQPLAFFHPALFLIRQPFANELATYRFSQPPLSLPSEPGQPPSNSSPFTVFIPTPPHFGIWVFSPGTGSITLSQVSIFVSVRKQVSVIEHLGVPRIFEKGWGLLGTYRHTRSLGTWKCRLFPYTF